MTVLRTPIVSIKWLDFLADVITGLISMAHIAMSKTWQSAAQFSNSTRLQPISQHVKMQPKMTVILLMKMANLSISD